VGHLKLSERILLRVWPDRSPSSPLLPRSASYNIYVQGTWFARQHPFAPLQQETDGWRLGPDKAASRWVEIDKELEDGRGMLPLPAGGGSLQGLTGAQLSRNPYGSVKVSEGPALARYWVHYADRASEAVPEAGDLRVPPGEQPIMDRLVRELGLADLPPGQALARLQGFFEREFHYSLRLQAHRGGKGALAHFLLQSRTGHCEYFASAAVLLLRRAGIPARYVRGWSVQEYSALEQAHVARARHAHAWVLAWVDGAWRDFDPTPPDWGALEAQNRPWWGPLQDLIARLGHVLAHGGRDGETDSSSLAWLLPPLAALLAWRIVRRGRRRIQRPAASPSARPDSPFDPVQRSLTARGRGRHNGETLREWVRRLEREGEPAAGQLRPAVELYYRECFDPAGLDRQDRERLRGMLEDVLKRKNLDLS